MNTSYIINKLKNRQPSILGHERFREFAVLLPLVEVEGDTHILFEVRSMELRSQPGDICFPGGKVDDTDKNTCYAALRETSEELGIPMTHINDVIPLDFMVSDFGRIIYPYVGTLETIEKIIPNKDEVEEVFTVPLSFFIETEPKTYKINFEVKPEDNFPFDLIMGGKNYDWDTRQLDEIFYKFDGKVIWGLTAKILTHFISLLKEDDPSL